MGPETRASKREKGQKRRLASTKLQHEHQATCRRDAWCKEKLGQISGGDSKSRMGFLCSDGLNSFKSNS